MGRNNELSKILKSNELSKINGKTFNEIVETMNNEQKIVLFTMVGAALNNR